MQLQYQFQQKKQCAWKREVLPVKTKIFSIPDTSSSVNNNKFKKQFLSYKSKIQISKQKQFQNKWQNKFISKFKDQNENKYTIYKKCI